MDPKEYDRIADLLLQIRKKYYSLTSDDSVSQRRIELIRYYLEQSIILNDELAVFDGRGLL